MPYIMAYCNVVMTLSLFLWGVCTAQDSHHSSVPYDVTSGRNLSEAVARVIPEGDWNNAHNETQRRTDSNKSQENSLRRDLSVVNHFYLWTRKNARDKSYEKLDPTKPNTVINSSFHQDQTYIIIHGFLGWGDEPWILQLKDKLLKSSDCNVISVDWPAGSEWFLLSYYKAVDNVPYVGQDTTLLLKSLVTLKALNLKKVHMIGHSLGAHVAGIASKPLRGEVGHITGLDPAGLTFHKVPSNQRIDSSDAEYVDIMHTNGCYTFWDPWGDCFGINENLGDSDFWPNGGKHQPACLGDNGDIGCNHEMAYKYYTESIDYSIDNTLFLARNCSSWDVYKIGNCSCGDEAQYMGYFVNTRVYGVFYLFTNTTAPYAVKDAECSPGNTARMVHAAVCLIALHQFTINKGYVFSFTSHCHLLKTGLALWNAQLGRAINEVWRRERCREERLGRLLESRYHLVTMVRDTQEVFSPVLQCYFATAIVIVCTELYLLAKCVGSGTYQVEGIVVLVLLTLQTSWLLFHVSLAAGAVQEQVGELTRSLSMSAVYITGGNFFIINRSFILTNTSIPYMDEAKRNTATWVRAVQLDNQTTEVLAHCTAITNPPSTKMVSTSNSSLWLLAVYQLLPTNTESAFPFISVSILFSCGNH
ncbi:pancreatic triacylglycerol lipase-like isoform X4 [Panulirus ornatus]|uniref:pancreatic triacylglycerol lipase-like isoform X4 n=1 Tax=Panulirus ornatus TaxID=150431 RepID=UPI003A86CE09